MHFKHIYIIWFGKKWALIEKLILNKWDPHIEMSDLLGEKIGKYISNKGFVSKTWKNHLKLNNKKTNNPIKTCVKGLNNNNDMQMSSKHMKRKIINMIFQ